MNKRKGNIGKERKPEAICIGKEEENMKVIMEEYGMALVETALGFGGLSLLLILGQSLL